MTTPVGGLILILILLLIAGGVLVIVGAVMTYVALNNLNVKNAGAKTVILQAMGLGLVIGLFDPLITHVNVDGLAILYMLPAAVFLGYIILSRSGSSSEG